MSLLPDRGGGDRMFSEEGDTLIELLLALVIIAISVSALLGALVTSQTTSGSHRTLATEDGILKSYAETVKYVLELQPTPAYSVACDPTAYNTAVSPTWTASYVVPSGYSVQIISCTALSASLQELTLDASAANGPGQSLQLVVRNPTA